VDGRLGTHGYDRKDRTLTINETEALTVRTIFDLFLKLKNVQRVQTELMRLNLTTKPYATPRGRAIGGCPLPAVISTNPVEPSLYGGD